MHLTYYKTLLYKNSIVLCPVYWQGIYRIFKKMMSYSEKRKHARFITLHLLNYTLLDDKGRQSESSMARTLDVSIGGIKIETTRALPDQAKLVISLELEDQLVDLEGKIIHNRENANRYVSGIQFQKVSPKEYKILRQYVDEFQHRKKEICTEDDLPKLDVKSF